VDLQALVNEAFARHQSGQLNEAALLYRQVLVAHPPIALVQSLAGDVATSNGDPAYGAALLRRALVLEPRKSSFHQLLAFAEASQGNLEQAGEHYASAVTLDPMNVSAMSDWANLVRSRHPDIARALARKTILINPENPGHLKLLAEMTVSGERLAGARLMRRAICGNPRDATAWKAIGLVAQAEKEVASADQALKRSLLLIPSDTVVCARLGGSLSEQGFHRQAVSVLRLCVTLNQTKAENWLALANALHASDLSAAAEIGFRRSLMLEPAGLTALENHLVQLAKADVPADRIRAGYRRALRVNPKSPRTWANFSKYLLDRGAYSAAADAIKSALVSGDTDRDMLVGLANAYRQSRKHQMAERYLRWARSAFPEDRTIQSGLLMGHNYESGVSARSLYQDHKAWAADWAPLEEPLGYDVDRMAGRRIHLGFVSPDLKRHPVGFFLLPVLRHLDRNQFRISVYSDAGKGDLFTLELRRHADHWFDVTGKDDDVLRDRILEDRVDILFDLAGHSAANRMGMFARRAAPVQMSWMGYVGTTGLDTMDYLVTDRFQTQPGTEEFYSERWLTLPDDYICFLAAPTSPPVVPSPVLANGFITFGSFNNPAKLTDETLDLWSRVLVAVPESRLLLAYRGFDDPGIQDDVRSRLSAAGVAPERVEFKTFTYHEEFLGGYGLMDIALDTMPYSGGLTTCEALWMGVPVISLAAQSHFAGRHSLTHLSNAGFPDWVGESAEEFVAIGADLASDIQRLAQIRETLRQRVSVSPLCDQERYARGVEEKLTAAWTHYCDEL
jgi:protein O-GlcNAc transferase